MQLITLVGVPGIGKSRLVWELLQAVQSDPDFVTWRQGRSLPYGEGVAYWALGEMVNAEAGILESDSAEEAGAKLRATVRDLIADAEEAAWVEEHVRALAGLETGGRGGDDRQRGRPRRGAGSSRRWRNGIRSSWCSRTCIGPTTPCSTSSTTWSTGRAAFPCW